MSSQHRYQIWVTAADFEELGNFCDTESCHHYENSSAFEAQMTIRRAGDDGEQPIVVDAPADPTDNYGADQRFNLFRTEVDDQGVYMPRKYRPGR